jgi:BirA family biotin operon repressor/biotin-[acetyl-CoA-carboxylase] ligase
VFLFEDYDIKLDTDVIGRNFIYCDEAESTNSVLLDKSGNYVDGTVLFAERQLAGRGRKDRKWYSTRNMNLTFSIYLKRKFIPETVHILNFGAALAVAFSLENLYQLKINLKWPNDVLVGNKKIAGILLESVSSGSKIEEFVIGIGLNANQISFQGDYNNFEPSSIKLLTDIDVDRERLLAEILNQYEEILDRAEADPSSVMNDWKNRCRMLGERVFISDDASGKAGIFEDLDEQGCILLRKEDRSIEKVSFGDIVQV